MIPIVTFIIYLPSIFRYEVVKCVLSVNGSNGSITYYKRNNDEFIESMFYSVSDNEFSFSTRFLSLFYDQIYFLRCQRKIFIAIFLLRGQQRERVGGGGDI
jgi:hypothetical protein